MAQKSRNRCSLESGDFQTLDRFLHAFVASAFLMLISLSLVHIHEPRYLKSDTCSMGESSLRVILKGGILPHANTFVFVQLIIKPTSAAASHSARSSSCACCTSSVTMARSSGKSRSVTWMAGCSDDFQGCTSNPSLGLWKAMRKA